MGLEVANRVNGLSTAAANDAETPAPAGSGYGRARLWLGISAVGTFVVLCAAGLMFDFPAQLQTLTGGSALAQASTLASFVAAYAIVQLPFDVLGGYVLPRRFGRKHPPLGRYIGVLARGVGVHALLLWLCAIVITTAGAYGGFVGVFAAGAVGVWLLLLFRDGLARTLASFAPSGSAPPEGAMPIRTDFLASDDEGFTGNIVGVIRPRRQILPALWRDALDADALHTVMQRRALAVTSGDWQRGRVFAVIFTLVGLAVSCLLVDAKDLGMAGGTIELSLWFSLWSFVGLLFLPMLSRRAVANIDGRALRAGASADAIGRVSRQLDALQDGEPLRPGLVETIFHTIPSVERRVEQIGASASPGFWDVARTSVYLSVAGCGLLGRAVHCNCGRPALWAFLPTD